MSDNQSVERDTFKARFLRRARTWTRVALVLLSLGLLPAWGFVSHRTPSGAPQRWNLSPPFDPAIPTNSFNPATGAIRYFLGAAGWSTTNTTAELNAARAAFDQWQAVPGTRLRFEEGGLVAAGADINTADRTNVVYWAKDSLFVNGGRDHIGGTLGVSYTRLEGEWLAEADLVLNGLEWRWFTNPAQPDDQAQFAEGIVLHEIGHWLGLAHSPAGGATMFARGDTGVNLQAGLSSDEQSALHALYGNPATAPPTGGVQGAVRRQGQPVLGAVVVAERAAEGVVAATVTDATGHYALPALPEGPVTLRVTPLDADGADYLVRGKDISPDYAAADTSFAPAGPWELSVVAGSDATFEVAVTGVRPDFWIGYLRVPTSQASSFAGVDAPVALRPGQSGQYVGVYSRNLPTNDVVLTITGDGLTVGPTLIHPNPVPGSGLRALSAQVSVAPTATAGSRSLRVERTVDGATAWANGFLVIEPTRTDWNFDGLEDGFQRRWFPLFTAQEAAPGADPDADGLDNAAEWLAGTVPTNALSTLRLESILANPAGVELTWSSVRLRRYQVWRRPSLAGTWTPAGDPVRATNSVARWLDPAPADSTGFYRVEVVP